jgi:ATP-binding cassette subfamily G (WHITE) protein 2
MIEHFSKLNYKCPSHFNPADYVIDILAIAGSSTEEFDKAEARVRKLQEDSIALCNFDLRSDAKGSFSIEDRQMRAVIAAPLVTQTKLLFRRQWGEVSRNRFAAVFKIFNGILISAIVIFLFSGLDDSQEAIQDRVGLLFFLVINQLFGPLFQTVAVFSKELGIVNRERGAHLYRMTPYYLAKTISGLPFDALPVILAMSIIYWSLDLNHSAQNYTIFFLCGLLMNLCSIGLGHGISALSGGNAEGAQAGVAPIAMFMLFCSGFYINTKNLPGIVSWMPDVSYMGNAYATLVINEFENLELQCTPADIQRNNCVSDGNLIVGRLGFDDRSVATNFIALIVNVLALNFLAIVFLSRSGPKYLVLNQPGYTPPEEKVPSEAIKG